MYYVLCACIYSGSYGDDCVSPICIYAADIDDGISGFALLVLSIWFLVMGTALVRRIGRQVNWQLSSQLSVIIKINFFILICGLCYLFRVLVYILIIYMTSDGTNSISASIAAIVNDPMQWFIITKWIPYLIPVSLVNILCVLMHMHVDVRIIL